jgi:hypothetical protein
LTLRWRYALAAAAIFAVEVAIASFVHDSFVRPYVGDSLAVALVYCVLRAATPLGVISAAAFALAIAFAVELGQLIGLLHLLGLDGSRLARIALGTDFEPLDFLAYATGALGVLAAERMRRRTS